METHTKSDRTTWKDWVIAIAFLVFVTIVVPTVAYGLPLLATLVVSSAFAIAIIAATAALRRRAR